VEGSGGPVDESLLRWINQQVHPRQPDLARQRLPVVRQDEALDPGRAATIAGRDRPRDRAAPPVACPRRAPGPGPPFPAPVRPRHPPEGPASSPRCRWVLGRQTAWREACRDTNRLARRAKFAELTDRVRYTGEPIIVEQQGQPFVAVVNPGPTREQGPIVQRDISPPARRPPPGRPVRSSRGPNGQ